MIPMNRMLSRLPRTLSRTSVRLALGAALSAVTLAGTAAASPAPNAYVQPGGTVSTVASTVPGNGDVNPYGVAVVPRTIGLLRQGEVLVSNFNNAANLQGTGTTIVEIDPFSHAQRLFAQIDPATDGAHCPGGIGLTTGLLALRSGWVVVGSLPAANGAFANAQAGCLLVVSPQGRVVQTIAGAGINGPWDMTAFDRGSEVFVFVSNVLNGTVAANTQIVNQGSITRLQLAVSDAALWAHESAFALPPLREVARVTIATGFAEKTDPAALVLGETGLGLGADGTLYVADTLNNRIVAISEALSRFIPATPGVVLSQNGGLNMPLGLTIAPNGDVLTVNGGDGNLVDVSRSGAQTVVTVDPAGAQGGTLFGLALAPNGGVYFGNDGTNTLNLYHS